MMLGYLLARAGIETVVLEKHADFLRDFRGDTVHPSTMQLLHELRILERFLERPHVIAERLGGIVGNESVMLADFRYVPARCRYIALMPQWEFLDFLQTEARRYPAFHLHMQAEVTGLIEEDGRTVGVRAVTPRGPLAVRAGLTVAADGRHSTVRAAAGLEVEEIGAPMDVLWMRVSRKPSDPAIIMGRFSRGRILVMIHRGEYWQCAYVIPKGANDEVRSRGLEAFRAEIARVAPDLADRVGELRDWNDIKLLTVAVNRLRTWCRPGLLCIGDAAHAMSPVGGVGINLAIQDAVAAANLLAGPLRSGVPSLHDLTRVQRRRELPTRLTQRMQVLIQNRVIRTVLDGESEVSVPWQLRLVQRFPILQRIPGRLIGIGFRPEHVRTPDASGT
jgi:2-polyprenyl-6-methoxyphenol hydroxylase-like FAD-dependent oxidoreductase